MVHIIIFSFNRAMQLEALLHSLRMHWSGTPHRVSVIYNTTKDDFQKGYEMLAAEYSHVEFIKETSRSQRYHLRDYLHPYNWLKLAKYPHVRYQRSDFRDLLNESLRHSECNYTMFLTDDSAFFTDVCLTQEQLAFIDQAPRQHQISLRLGLNNAQKPTSILQQSDGTIRWRFSNHPDGRSWGYRFSVDAHIYATSIMRSLLGQIIFSNPTTLEAHINDYVQKVGLLNEGLSLGIPYILSFPINMVQQIADNESLGVSEEKLNHEFIQGYRLEYQIPPQSPLFQVYPEYILLTNPISGDRKNIKTK